jgi:autotransporter-associated beta strand protein
MKMAVLLFSLLVATLSLGQAQTSISKANNATALNVGTSWSGGTVPTATDVAVWDSTVTTANSVLLGGNLSFGGIRISNPGGAVTIQSGNTLTLGSSGINMSSAAQNLIINSAFALGANQTWTIASGRTLQIGGATAFNENGFTANVSGAGTLDWRYATTNTFSGLLSQTKLIQNSATGVLTLANTANTFTDLFIAGGKVRVSTIGNFGQASAAGSGGVSTDITLAGNNTTGIFEYTGSTASANRTFNMDQRAAAGSGIFVTDANSTLTISGAVKSSAGTTPVTSNTWTFGGAGNLVLSGVISDSSSTATVTGLTKSGTGKLTLSGANTFAGDINIQEGVVQVGSGGTVGSIANSGSIVLTGGSLAFNRSDNLVQGTSFLTNGTVITGAGGLIKMGSGNLTLNAANTYSGATRVEAGKLILANNLAIQNSAFDTDGLGVLSLNAGTTSFNLGGLTGSGVVAPENYNSVASINLNTVSGVSRTYSGVLSNGAAGMTLIKSGAGTQILSGNNTFSGGTTLSAGTLGVGSSAALGSGDLTVGGSSTLLAAADGLNIANTASLNSGTLTVDVQGNTLTSSGTINGTGALAKTGVGTLILSRSNNYSGGTTLSTGQLDLNNANAAGSGALTIAGGSLGNSSGSAVTLANNSQNWSGNFSFAGANDLNLGTGAVTLGANSTVTVSTNSLTVGGDIGGAYTLSKAGAGTMVLSGANSHSGTTTVSAGVLNIRNGSALGDTVGGTTVSSGAALELQGGITVGNEALSLNGSGVSSDGALRNVSGNNSYGGLLSLAGATRINSDSGTLTLANIGTISGTTGLTLGGEGNTVVQSAIGTTTSSGTLTKDGSGIVTLNGVNTYTNSTTVSAGTLRILGNTNWTGALSVASGASLDMNMATLTSSALNLTGSGRLSNITLGGDLTISAANAGIDFAGTLNANAKTINLGGQTINVSAGFTTNGFNISGGSGIMRFTGSTTNPTALSSSNTPINNGLIQVQNGATLEFASNSSFNSYRAITASSSNNNPTILISGGTLTGIDYLGVGGGTNSTGTLKITSGSVTLATNSANGIFMGQSTGTGSFIMEGGNFTGNNTYGVFKIANGTANVTISNGTVSNPSPTVWGLSGSGGGVVNFTMTGGQFAGTNAKFNFGQYTTNASFTQSGGLMDLKSSEAWLGTYSLSGGTNRANFMTIGMSGNTATYTVSGTGVLAVVDPSVTGLLRLGDVGSTGKLIQDGGSVLVGTGNTKKDIYVGYGSNGIGRYELRGGVLDLNGEILVSSNASGSLVLDGGTLRSSAGVARGSFIASNVVTQVGANGAVIEVANAGVTNTIQSSLLGAAGSSGGLTKTGVGGLVLSSTNGYTGTTTVSGGLLAVASTGSIQSSTNTIVNSSATLLMNGAGGRTEVNSGGTLKGSGTLGDVVLNGGTLAPGNSPGLLTAASLNASSSGNFFFELGSPSSRGITYDAINVSGLLTMSSTTLFDFSAWNSYVFQASDTYDLLDWGTADFGSGATAFNSSTLLTSLNQDLTLGAGLQWDVSTFTADGKITVAVPEPSSGALLIMGFAMLMGFRALRRP